LDLEECAKLHFHFLVKAADTELGIHLGYNLRYISDFQLTTWTKLQILIPDFQTHLALVAW